MGYRNYANTALKTPQTKPIPGREAEMVENAAGGYVFKQTDWETLNRFLILGTEGGTFYVGEQELTEKNAGVAIRCAKADAAKTVAEIVRVSDEGLAVKNDPAIFALALVIAHADDEGRKIALNAIPKVCRIPTHLFMMVEMIDRMKGWSRSRRRAIANWYLNAPIGKLAEHLIKYRQRDGWSHRDVLRLAHPATDDAARAALLRFAVAPAEVETAKVKVEGSRKKEEVFAINVAKRGQRDEKVMEPLQPIVQGYLHAQAEGADLPALVREYGLPREALPTTALNDPKVWSALNEKMPITATIRNLGKMSRVGLFADKDEVRKVVERLTDEKLLAKGRVHPLAVFKALRTYATGRGERSEATWDVNPKIVDALDEAYEIAFKYAEPTGLDYLVGVDVSGSMGGGSGGFRGSRQINRSMPPLPCEMAAAVMHYIVRVERNVDVFAFDESIHSLAVSKRQRLDDVTKEVMKRGGGGTDCHLLIQKPLRSKDKYDVIVGLTDSETWAGGIHATQAWEQYRNKVNAKAKLVWLGVTATGYDLVDPTDPSQLGIAGFDASVGQAISAFVKR